MKNQITFYAALLVLGLGAAGTAQAQYGPAYPRLYERGVPPSRAIAVVRAAGMTPVSPVMRRGPNYVVIAAHRGGGRVRVVVNGYNGMIMRVRPVVAMRPYGPVVADAPYVPRPRAAVGPEIKDPPPPAAYGVPPDHAPEPYHPRARADVGVYPVPPRNIPNARIATAPDVAPNVAAPNSPMAPAAPHTLASHPPQTPLPRPRPSVASNETSAAPPAEASPPPAAKPAEATAAKPPEAAAWPKPVPSDPKSGELKMVPVAPLD